MLASNLNMYNFGIKISSEVGVGSEFKFFVTNYVEEEYKEPAEGLSNRILETRSMKRIGSNKNISH